MDTLGSFGNFTYSTLYFGVLGRVLNVRDFNGFTTLIS